MSANGNWKIAPFHCTMILFQTNIKYVQYNRIYDSSHKQKPTKK